MENTLVRLRQTERLFREAAILAALDVEARQLFTFYKKVDITDPKDQKTLLRKFGDVLRSHTCTIAYKTAIRLPDLMKPEQARLYRLFTTAIISSIKLLPNGDSALQPLGPNLYLVERAPSGSESDQFEPIRRWSLHSIDLQVVPSGHIILTIGRDDRFLFLRMTEVARDLDQSNHSKKGMAALYLAPIGRVARLIGRGIDDQMKPGNTIVDQQVGATQGLDSRKELWKEVISSWLKDQMSIIVEANDALWIEAQIPVQEVDLESTGSQSFVTPSEAVSPGAIAWRTICWPAHLCFLLDSKDPLSEATILSNEDPMQFVQDWIAGTADGSSTNTKPDPRRRDGAEEDDEPLFADEGAFDDPEHFQPFGPPAFPASQTIYPTPPDVVMTHPTPGLSSIDGIALTPANIYRGPADVALQQDEEMQDFEEVPTTNGLSEFYDEDLFEEMPDDNFGQEGTADEPNWDFFDRPGFDSKAMTTSASNRGDGISKLTGAKDHAIEAEIETSGDPNTVTEQQARPKDNMSSDNALSAQDKARQSSHQIAQLNPIRPKDPKDDEHVLQAPSKPRPPVWQSADGEITPQAPNARRRSSVYDGVVSLISTSDRDSKYTADGDYWFDPTAGTSRPHKPPKPTSLFRRSISGSSESDVSMTDSTPSPGAETTGNEAAASLRQWTEYHPESPGVVSHHSEMEKKTARQELEQLLALLKQPSLVEPPTLLDFSLEQRSRTIPQTSLQKVLHIAHILVDQMSQTSLISHDGHRNEFQHLTDGRMSVIADLSGINTSANPSSLLQLTNLNADNHNGWVQGRVVKIHPNQICLRRVDRPLIAAISILGFWDTLSLQPESGPKNTTALCVHPTTQNVAEGSLNLLQRITDTYNSCGFGTHTVGRIAGLTETGLVPWDLTDVAESGLFQTAQKVGGAIASLSDFNGTVLVYMISRGESPAAYLEICHAFYNLFESFKQGLGDKHDILDVALQIIPHDFVASPDTLVIPPQSAYVKLATEVYNRLPPFDHPGPPAASGSAVVLANSENAIHFHLTPTYGSPLTKDGPFLHLAYSSSSDNRWITAAWTDEHGQIALTMCYCCRIRDSGRRRPRQDVLREIWETSQDLMRKVRGPWRLAVVKNGYYDPAELLEWRHVSDGSSAAQKRCSLMLLSAKLDPTLKVFPPSPQGKMGQMGLQNMCGTPASTPQAGITSPDQPVPATPTPGGSSIMNAPTPPEPGFDPNAEGDLTLVDPAEDSWCVILPYGVKQTDSMFDPRPAVATGLLMKRKGSKNDDGCTMIEISLISANTQGAENSSETSADALLEDVIKQYRGLATLSVTRGCIDQITECLPWHIATSAKGSQILGQVM